MKMKIKLLGMIALFLIGHIGVVNAVTPVTPVAPGGATLDALASDIMKDISLGPLKTQRCFKNPYIARATGTSTCPVLQSVCANGIAKTTPTSCIIIPSANTDDPALIKSILGNIFGPIAAKDIFQNIRPKGNTSTNIEGCSAPSDAEGMMPGSLPPGGTPWCFYKIGTGSDYGLPFPFWKPRDKNVTMYGKQYSIQQQVTMSEFIKPRNWECYEVNIQVQAHCVVIPTKVKSILGHFGIKVK